MDTRSVAYVLCRIEDDSSLTPVSRHGDFLTGIVAGGYAVEVEDPDFACFPIGSAATKNAWSISGEKG